MQNLYNVNVAALEVLPTPEEIKQRLPLSEAAADTVFQARETIKRILDRQDPRLFVVVGPCSIHDVEAARDYARRLKALADEVNDTLFIVMRVYFEKPRTTVGWKGLINDPRMDDTFHIDEGLQIARGLLLELAEMGLPAGIEALDPIIPQYISDLVAWTAIGARTTESQTHREIASGLSSPVGFKNGTNGNLDVAINALQSAARPHSFLGINPLGQSAVIRTLGNRYGHVVLRGGDRPNYDSVSIALCEKALRDKKLPVNIVVDCSHANAFKDPAMQPLVMRDCTHQIIEGNQSIVGLMIESNLEWGNQSIPADRSQLKYGVSVTDACVDWTTTGRMLRETAAKLKGLLSGRSAA
ncbi:MAG TPA: 3-deoxy-7-phosphoheptulonate synthase [Candidatus Competibacteraceae bacterium]|nr:3-deoxy-7-phosphoheptulonate synthase [Candidatus Competibacteraceae bacterium]MCP5132945.1 3-deoxy-7-phosphoheptulonate synthase [Gammaproteobacteria bacterium]HPF58257.1 3-deoxy-7-phosphoheptulonate synthase [Candidatus Competibacteraceae bacterium]HRX71303.1 3-deoxy-7-phosphoheptulonate synthase [Candidatus Competibacteraceae bacterium]